ncbi:L-lactate dehydrogenase [Pseudomonas sp. sp1636]|uniref:L-lactate dehydrogenase n=1 Tax=Pseudomonas sp. sp1636 TaxID=3036707 RepID=UPI0025A58DF3|nr:L-lactate dehydrogenase [Pseudomonas sp. sp1636]MDM8348126.1 L-lactate dehydrogenase [Pseudomonas sp. sp1636]
MSLFARAFAASCCDYRRLARRRLPQFLFDYIDGGANAEQTLAANSADFRQLQLRQRVLRDVSQCDTAGELIGQPASLPLALAPLGMAGLFARRGEARAASAAARCGVPFSLSSVGICSLTEVHAASAQPCWFQLYMLRDRNIVQDVLRNAWAQGCRTLLFTVDLAVAGIRRRDQRNGMHDPGWRGRCYKTWQLLQRPAWLMDVGLLGRPHHFANLSQCLANPADINGFKAWLDAQFDPSVTWADIRWLRQQWPGKLLLKGILEVDDALLALDCGADGMVLSNHGGRQLDGVSSSVAQLPSVVQALGGRLPVLLDGGVRSGVDVFKALALGAQGVLIGRPWAWALAAGGQPAVEQLLHGFKQELAVTMALCGVNRIEQIDRQMLRQTPLGPVSG